MSLEIKSVNWCSLHRTNFPCNEQCPQCIWPKCETFPQNGWELDFNFLKRVQSHVKQWGISEEEIEAVLIAAREEIGK